MSKKILTLILTFIAIFSLSNFNNLSVNASSTPQDLYVVEASAGLNLRNENCEVIDTIKNQTTVIFHYAGIGYEPGDPYPLGEITCNIDGINYQMLYIWQGNGDENPGYAAKKYLKKVFRFGFEGLSDARKEWQVNASIGLNFRDKNCKKIGAFPNKTIVDIVPVPEERIPLEPLICKVKGEYYSMSKVSYKNRQGYMANYYLDI